MTLRLAELIESYVDELKGKGAIKSKQVEQAFRRVERHLLLEGFYELDKEAQERFEQLSWTEKVFDPSSPEPEILAVIYSDSPLVIRVEDGRPTSSTSQPALVAEMLELLELERGMNVLEIGAGTGYNAALMQEIVRSDGHVTTIDIQGDVVEQTRRLLKAAGYDKIEVIAKDGALGHPEIAPYDRIVATVGCPDISFRWSEQLAEEGFMLIPLQHGAPHCDPLVKLRKSDPDRLNGQVVGWSGFMLIQGELAVPCLWPSVDPYQNLKDRPPDWERPLFSELEGAKMDQTSYEAGERAWWDFHYFLAVCDHRAYLGISNIGLSDPDGLGTIAITAEGIKLWGDKSLYRDLERIYREWKKLGRPELTDWRVEFTPKEKEPSLQASRENKVWTIERQFSKEIIRLDPSRK